MFGKRVHLFTMSGFQVRADTSWFIIFLFLVWMLAAGYFPNLYEGRSLGTYILLGLLGAIGLFASIVIHEYCHAWVARRQGLPMEGITLWVFGGIAEMSKEPRSAKDEFFMAAAGPAASFLLAGIFYGLAAWVPSESPYFEGVFSYLWRINLILAIFNLIPAFPLDGGRILRSVLWQWKGKIRWATKVSSNIGSGFGFALMILGVLGFLTGNLVGGIWYFLIGLFVRWAARMSYVRLRMNDALEGETIRELMGEVHPVPADVPVDEAVRQYMVRYRSPSLPVIDNKGMVMGILRSKAIKKLSPSERMVTAVSELTEPLKPKEAVDVQDSAQDLLGRMNMERDVPLLVLEDKRPVGVLIGQDLMNYVALKLELSGEEDDVPPHMRLSRAS